MTHIEVASPLAETVGPVGAVEVSSAPTLRPWPRSGAAALAAGPLELPAGRPSIAVLPFHVRGESEDQTYFGDGVVEDIIGALAALREVFVISRSSTLRYGAGADVRTVGRDVVVGYVLSGSVRRADARLRVSAELAETSRGTVVWASHFDGISEDLFALQDQIASRVVSTIAPQVREAELRRAPASGRTVWKRMTVCYAAWRSATISISTTSPRHAPGWNERLPSIQATPRPMPCSRTGTASGSARAGRRIQRRTMPR